MTVPLSVRYEGAALELNNVKDVNGDRFWVVDVEGLGSMAPELSVQQRYDVGAVLTQARYQQREILIKGMGQGNPAQPGSVLRAIHKVRTMFADHLWLERWLYIDMDTGGVSTQYKVVPGGEIAVSAPKGSTFEFEVPFTALDPRGYAQIESTASVSGGGSPITAVNGGLFPTYVTATLTNAAGNPYLQVVNTLGTFKLQLSGSMPAGVVVDFQKKRTVHPTNGPQNLASTPRVWWTLLPGNNTVSSVGNWDLKWRSAYR